MADNLNISQDMVNNLMNILKNTNTNNTEKDDDNIYNSNKKENADNCDNSNNSDSINSFDFETIIKIKNIMDNLNTSNSQDSKLLYSLKPYLRKSRQKKLDQYINILKLSQVSKLFNQKGDDN